MRTELRSAKQKLRRTAAFALRLREETWKKERNFFNLKRWRSWRAIFHGLKNVEIGALLDHPRTTHGNTLVTHGEYFCHIEIYHEWYVISPHIFQSIRSLVNNRLCIRSLAIKNMNGLYLFQKSVATSIHRHILEQKIKVWLTRAKIGLWGDFCSVTNNITHTLKHRGWKSLASF